MNLLVSVMAEGRRFERLRASLRGLRLASERIAALPAFRLWARSFSAFVGCEILRVLLRVSHLPSLADRISALTGERIATKPAQILHCNTASLCVGVDEFFLGHGCETVIIT